METLIADLLWLSRIESVEESKDDQIDMVALLTDLCEELAADGLTERSICRPVQT